MRAKYIPGGLSVVSGVILEAATDSYFFTGLLIGCGLIWLVLAYLGEQPILLRYPRLRDWMPIQWPPSWGDWDQNKKFHLVLAAMLWAEASPVDEKMSHRAYQIFRLLKEAIDRGELNVIDMAGSEPNKQTVVSRDALTDFAHKNGYRTPFLFKDERPT